MTKLTKIICVLLVLLAIPVWLLMAGFSPMLLDGGATMTKAQKLFGTTVIGAILALPLWVAYFGWRTFKGWRTDGAGSAILMALPALLMIGMMLVVNFGRFGP